jgi:GPH family glycoside/pentoside/hexuronide:cation symporter
MNTKLSLGLKIRYGVADMGIALISSAISFFLLIYYTDVAGIDPAIAGWALLVGKLTWDAINDPLFGYWSDRVHSKFGRRRIFMIIGVFPLGLAIWIMFSLPAGLAGTASFFAILLTFLLVDTFLTMVSVPYYAMTPELTRDYSDRAGLTTVRMIFSVIGYILGAALTTILVGIFESKGMDTRQAWSMTGILFGVVVVTTVLITTLTVKETGEVEEEPSELPAVKALATTFKNDPFLKLMLAFILSSLSFALLTALVPYFITYQLNMPDQVSYVLLVMLVSIGIFLVPAKMISDRINKGPAYALGLFIASVAVICSFFLPHHPTPLIYVIAFVAGMGFSAQWVSPWSMLPDVVEYDEKMTGERREGIYYGMWAFLTKFTGAFGVAIAGWSLSYFGYVPNVEQTTQSLFGIRLFFGIVPAIVILLSLPILIRYPITRENHAALVKELAESKATTHPSVE